MSGLRRAEGVVESEMEGDLFLVRPDDGEIFHLDRMAAGVWTLLAEPMSRAEVLAIFREAFPEVGPERIAADLDAALDEMLRDRLITELENDLRVD